MRGIIDRFEGGFAVVETDGGFVNIPREKLPAGAGEGSVLEIGPDGGASLDKKVTADREKMIRGMMDQLFDRSKGND